MIINLTAEQIDQLRWQILNDTELKDLIGVVMVKLSSRGELELLKTLADYQKQLVENQK